MDCPRINSSPWFVLCGKGPLKFGTGQFMSRRLILFMEEAGGQGGAVPIPALGGSEIPPTVGRWAGQVPCLAVGA